MSDKQNLIDQKHGLRVYYYSNIHWEGEPVYEEVMEAIEFNWSNEEKKPIPSPFSAILKGFIDIVTSGKYTFKITSDDGSWLYIDDILIIDNGGSHSIKSATGTLALEKGTHKIAIKYFDRGGGAVLDLSWLPPGGAESGIPVERLKRKGEGQEGK